MSGSIKATPGMVINGTFRLDVGSSVAMRSENISTVFTFHPGSDCVHSLVVVDVSTSNERAMSILRLETMNPSV